MQKSDKIMALTEVLKRKVKRAKETLKDLEVLIDQKQASSRQQQEYIALKAKVEVLEDTIDLAEGMID